MPSPFPGMDPYLESPALWRDVHGELISEIRHHLAPKLRPRYVARVEQYNFVFGPDDPADDLYIVPDVQVVRRAGHPPEGSGHTEADGGAIAIAEPIDLTGLMPRMARHRYLEIRDAANRQVVTIIEVVSPANKRAGAAGRRKFQEKRTAVEETDVNWLEIDLLRAGQRTIELPRVVPASHYLAYADRTTAEERRQWAWPMSLRRRLPVLPVPLRVGDDDVSLDLQAALDSAYDRAAYDMEFDYAQPPASPLSEDDARWADALLREKGLRS